MSFSGSELRRRKGSDAPASTTLKIGYRKGWPGQAIQNLVTHAVFQVGNGEIRGYGMVNGKGTIVDDKDSVAEEHRDYTWYEPTLVLLTDLAVYFEQRVQFQASQFSYTGVGGNCYTPVLKSLNELRTLLVQECAAPKLVTDVDRLIRALAGSNGGMGTTITNQGYRSGEALFNAIGSNGKPKEKIA